MVKFNTIFLGSVLKSLFFFLFIPLLGLGTTYCEMSDTESLEERDEVRSNTKTTCEDCEVIRVKDPGQGNDIRSNFEAAWEKASSGDTILLPAGSFSLVGTIKITNVHEKPDVHIKGMGSGSNGTRVYRNYETTDYMIELIGLGSYDTRIEVSDIWFQGMEPHFRGDTGGSECRFKGINFQWVYPYLHHCKMQWLNGRTVQVLFRDPSHIKGLISDNEFIDNVYYDTGFNQYRGGVIIPLIEKENWFTISPGTQDNLYVEDNYFTGQSSAIGTSKGGTYVFRYNRVERNTNSGATDMHGGQPDWSTLYPDYKYSSRFAEIYNNTFIKIPTDDPIYMWQGHEAFECRGGEAVFWGNTLKNYTEAEEKYSYSISLKIAYNYWANDTSYYPEGYEIPPYPIDYQTGWESGSNYGENHSGTDPSTHGAGDIYIWDNEYINSGGVSIGGGSEDHPDEYMREGRDYHVGVARPGYTPYQYPHPWRDTVKTVSLSANPTGGG